MIKMTKKLEEMMQELKSSNADTFFHAVRVKNLTFKLLMKANEMGITTYSEQEIVTICKGALLHDIGKLFVTNYILTKEESLSPKEKKAMDEHTIKGLEVIKSELADDEYDMISNICMYHHERIDGNGYFSKSAIPVYVQIVSICDAYEALCADRVYRPAFSCEKALQIIEEGGCGAFDQKIYDCLVAVVNR